TKHLRARIQPRVAALILAMATAGRRRVGCAKPDRSNSIVWRICFRLGTRTARDCRNQPFRSVRYAAGLEILARETAHRTPIRNSGALPGSTSSAVRWLVLCFLVYPNDDRNAPVLCIDDLCLYSDRDSA